MKKRFLLLPLFAGCAYFTLSSNSGGYPTNKSGSDSSAATGCGGSGCHGSSASSSVGIAILLDSAGTGNVVTKYTPGKQYVIRMYAGVASLPKFGFQLSVIKGMAGSTASNAGTPGTLPAGVSFSTGSGGPGYFTHTSALTASSVGMGLYVDSVNIPWTAPAAGTGTVKMYGIINAVNANGNADVNDKYNTKYAQFTEVTTAAVNDVVANNVSVGPNPVSGSLQVNLEAGQNAHIVVTGLDGRVVYAGMANGNATLNTDNWIAGIYYVKVMANGAAQVFPVVKQ
jgi:hypothetical protein